MVDKVVVYSDFPGKAEQVKGTRKFDNDGAERGMPHRLGLRKLPFLVARARLP
jgi:hypothetical protein